MSPRKWKRERPAWSVLYYLMAQRGKEKDHPVKGEFMAYLRDHAEANSTREVALVYLAQVFRDKIVRRDNSPEYQEAMAKRARKAAKMKSQGMTLAVPIEEATTNGNP